MKKNFLLLAAAAVAINASAEQFPVGEAFSYDFGPSFTWGLTQEDGDLYAQYPSLGLQGQASFEEGWGLASWWFNARKAANTAQAMEDCPAVEFPTGSAALQMRTTRWDGFGNFNFALPMVNQKCRIRVVYYVDYTAAENTWFNGGNKKPFQVKLMDDNDQDNVDYPFVSELNEKFWDNPGWRIAEFQSNLEHDHYYISLLWDAGGLSCQCNVPMYVREVSVVPVDKIQGWQDLEYPTEEGRLTVVADMPDLITTTEVGAVKNVDADNATAPVEYFNLQGIRVAEPTNGMYIRRQGNKTTKVAL